MTESRSTSAPPALPAQLDALLARWLAGGEMTAGVMSADPATLAALLPETRAAEPDALALLAIATQCRQFLLAPTLPGDARPGPAWPEPALPLLPEPLRARFRSAMKSLYAPQQQSLLRLIAARGWMAHPFDWRPAANDESAPASYDAWRRRAAALRAPQPSVSDDDLADLLPAERRRQLIALRVQDADAARVRIDALMPTLPAEERLGLLDALATALGAGDLPLLEGLTGDRSERVRQAAARLRARLGATQPLREEDRAELRGWFEIGSSGLMGGLINRKLKVTLTPLKTKPQHATRRARLQQLGWADLCAVLDLDAATLLAAWTPADEDDDVLLECAAQSLPEALLPALAERLLFERAVYARRGLNLHTALSNALARLPAAARAQCLHACFSRESALHNAFEVLSHADGPLPVDWRELQRSPYWDALQKTLRAHVANSANAMGFLQDIAAFACLLPQPTAQALLQHVLAAGVSPVDGALDALTLSAQLAPSNAVAESAR